jgi:PAS domain S-box-containing protein
MTQPDAKIEVDCQGLVGLWSPEAAALFGFSADEMLGQSIERIISPEFRARHWAGFRRFAQTGVSRLPEISTSIGLTKSGARLRVVISVEARRNVEGRITGVLASMKKAG